MLGDKVIVVTGGAGLLGRQFCKAIAASRGIAIVADVDLDAARTVATGITASGGRADAVAVDITSATSLRSLIDAVLKSRGRVDAVVNAAYPRNRNWGAKLEDVGFADFCENLSMHLGGYYLVAQQFALQFREQGGGNIVNLGSIYGTQAPRFDIYEGTTMTVPVEYAAIKAGVIQLTRYFAQYFKNDGIRCNTLSPGGILDGQPGTFLGKYASHCGGKGMLDAGDVVGALLFLLSDASRHLTGQNLIVDDGFCL
ncbi:MAG: hypothetical protein RLZZ200_390 [Pseudomonadota bacterium]|jgi:NAD(P)-dependent dehydrogenase (short-subunit alcohol dehydrogenase family)